MKSNLLFYIMLLIVIGYITHRLITMAIPLLNGVTDSSVDKGVALMTISVIMLLLVLIYIGSKEL